MRADELVWTAPIEQRYYISTWPNSPSHRRHANAGKRRHPEHVRHRRFDLVEPNSGSSLSFTPPFDAPLRTNGDSLDAARVPARRDARKCTRRHCNQSRHYRAVLDVTVSNRINQATNALNLYFYG